MLLDALDGVVLSDAERASLTGFEVHTIENIAVVITRVCRAGEGSQ